MTPTRFADTFPDLDGRRVIVIGAGKSGRGAARLILARGASVVLADRREAEDLPEPARALGNHGVRLHPGGHPASLLEDADLLVMSPGVPVEIEIVREARARGIAVWGEVELAARFTRGRVIGITGSNGKSTVTAMTGAILRASGIAGATGGNLDTPLADLLGHDEVDAVHAVELSSFQLETIEVFRPAIAVLLNLSPDHLDRHGSVDAYAAAKARLFENQTESDAAILNTDDAPSQRFTAAIRGELHEISTRRELDRGAFVHDGRLVLRTHLGEEALLEVGSLSLRGEHNVSNALAAALAARLGGATIEAINEVLGAFASLPHRLERVDEIGGVTFYNDSKATNPAAALPALDAFAAGTIQLIVGGKDKGGDWDTLVAAAARRARGVFVIGADPEPVARRFEGSCRVRVSRTLDRAVEEAFDSASPGDVVLLSPACASFDQFENFERRGDVFRDAVGSIGGRHA